LRVSPLNDETTSKDCLLMKLREDPDPGRFTCQVTGSYEHCCCANGTHFGAFAVV
jgi:hypothetical protein